MASLTGSLFAVTAIAFVLHETVKTVMEDLPARMSFIGTVCMLSVVSIVIMGLLAFYDIVGVLQSA